MRDCGANKYVRTATENWRENSRSESALFFYHNMFLYPADAIDLVFMLCFLSPDDYLKIVVANKFLR